MQKSRLSWFLKLMLMLSLAFLYIPLVVLVIYSFNESKLVTVWGGFSTKWYSALLENDTILEAAWLSLRIAAASSLAAVVLGTLAGYAMARIKRFRGSTLFAGMISAPMVMPDVITGLSMLLLIIQVQMFLQGSELLQNLYFDRGFFTIFLGHTTLCMAYITVVIRSRLVELDQSLEEAAMDLGARPLKIFFVITLPLIAPAIASGFLLGITLSLDDLVITSFLSGPGSSTLPQVIFSKIKLGLDPQMNVLATILIGIIGTLVIVINYWMMRQATKRDREAAEAYRQEKFKQVKITDPERHTNRLLTQMQRDLHLSEPPAHIECFDNSNIQGTNPVAACVVFKNAKPSKKDYRHFNIKTVEGPNDFASMEEVVYRRYRRLLDEEEPLPQLIIIDGGKGQLSAALKALELLDLRGKIAIVGIAKRLEEIFYPGDSVPLYLDKKSETLKVIQHLRNEAHRFGITFHRQKRSASAIHSELEQISGVGKQTQEALLKHFKSVKRLKEAPKEEIIACIGLSRTQKVWEYFHPAGQSLQ